MLFRRKIKVVIDTNLWISFLISDDYEKLDLLFSTDKIRLLFSERLFAEFIKTASREKFRRYFSENDVNELSEKMKKVAKIIRTNTIQTQCRDAKDNFLLELAVDGKADYLITGDKDLLILETVGKTKIMKMSDFLISVS